jgi:hypothetical protein
MDNQNGMKFNKEKLNKKKNKIKINWMKINSIFGIYKQEFKHKYKWPQLNNKKRVRNKWVNIIFEESSLYSSSWNKIKFKEANMNIAQFFK